MMDEPKHVTVLGLGAMGGVLAAALVDAGHRTTVWNRSAAKAAPLADRGAVPTGSVEAAVTASPVVFVCLLDHASTLEVLRPVVADLAGRTLVNLTTTTPAEAQEMGAWAGEHGMTYLDGCIMAVPEMIGGPGAAVFYSGSEGVFGDLRPLLDLWGESSYFGSDPGRASLYDMALLSGMYIMFAGFFHGAAMVTSEGDSATDFAALATPFLGAMTSAFAGYAATVDTRDYEGEGQQSLEFSDLTRLMSVSSTQGISTEVLRPVHELIQRQMAAGHGKEGFARIFEELKAAPQR